MKELPRIAFKPPKRLCLSFRRGYQQLLSKPTTNTAGWLTRRFSNATKGSHFWALSLFAIPTYLSAQSPIPNTSILGALTGSENGYQWITIFDEENINALTVACYPETTLTAFFILDGLNINDARGTSTLNNIPMDGVSWVNTAEGTKIVSSNLIFSLEDNIIMELEKSPSITFSSGAFSAQFTKNSLIRSFISRDCGFTEVPSMPWRTHDLGYENTSPSNPDRGVEGKLYIYGSDIFFTFEDGSGQDALSLGQQTTMSLRYSLDEGQLNTVGADILATTTWPQRRAYRVNLTENLSLHETLTVSFALNGSEYEFEWQLNPWPYELYRNLSSGGQ